MVWEPATAAACVCAPEDAVPSRPVTSPPPPFPSTAAAGIVRKYPEAWGMAAQLSETIRPRRRNDLLRLTPPRLSLIPVRCSRLLLGVDGGTNVSIQSRTSDSRTTEKMFNSSLQLPSFLCLAPASNSLYLALASTLLLQGSETTCSLGSSQLRIISACASLKPRLGILELRVTRRVARTSHQ